MALRQLKTNLRSLKYGHDRPGGGSSNQPYIQVALPQGYTDPFSDNFQRIRISSVGFSDDSLVRGGALSLLNSAQDLIRVTKFMTDFPKGPLFIAKQVGLQFSNPKIETGKVIGIENTRIYNLGINTLAQIPTNAFGIHFDRSGLTPIIDDQSKYLNVVKLKNQNNPNDNRLVGLYNDKIVLDSSTNLTNQKLQQRLQNLQSKINKATPKIAAALTKVSNSIQKSLNSKYFIIDEYNGGPNSLLGIGKTTINRYTFSENPRTNNFIEVGTPKLNYITLVGGPSVFASQYIDDIGIDTDPNSNISPSFISQIEKIDKTQEIIDSLNKKSPADDSHLNSISFTYDSLIQQKLADTSQDFIGLIGPDFRNKINTQAGKTVLNSSDYRNFNMMTRIGIGDPGKPSRDRTKVNISDESTQDKVNMLPLFSEETRDIEGGTVLINNKKYSFRDLVKFHFEAVDNDNLNKTIKIIFRAFIDSFSDNYNSDWMGHKFVGRGEQFYTYNGFNRQISLSFKIAPQSRDEMKPLYQKLNYLVSNTTPDYQQNGFMRGNFLLFTFGNWCFKQPIIINNISVNIKENYPWEIAIDRPEDGNDNTMTELPQVLDVSMSITLIHNFIPRKGPTIPFINTGVNSNNNWLKPSEFANL